MGEGKKGSEQSSIVTSANEGKAQPPFSLPEGNFLSMGDFPAGRWVLPQFLRCILIMPLSSAISLQVSCANPPSTANQVPQANTSHQINPGTAALSDPNMAGW